MSTVSSWLGLRGYAISKSALDTPELMQIRKDLSMRPYAPQSPIKPEPFPIYVETPQTIYVPRYYGLETYGEPEENRLRDGVSCPNLVSKDAINRYKLIRGHRIHFMNGFSSFGAHLDMLSHNRSSKCNICFICNKRNICFICNKRNKCFIRSICFSRYRRSKSIPIHRFSSCNRKLSSNR